jgi:hypothetical protein
VDTADELSAPYRAASPEADASSDDGSLFPAAVAVPFLLLGFFFTRVFVGLAGQLPWLGHLGTIATITGVLLALLAVGRALWESPRGALRPVTIALRALAFAPVAALALVATASNRIPHALQWAGLVGLAATVLLIVGRTLVAALLAGAAATLLVGELIEVIGPMARFAAAPGSFWPRFADALGSVSEAATFVGVLVAAVWAVTRARKLMGTGRALTWLAMPVGLALVMATLPLRLPRTTEMVARSAFGVRFDLTPSAGAGHPSRASLTVYTLLFSGLVLASFVSFITHFAASERDRGGVHRALAWLCVLVAGFGAVTLAGPVDPLRAVVLCAGVALFEQAFDRDDVIK